MQVPDESTKTALSIPALKNGGFFRATDKYGASWQIVPAVLPDMMTDADSAKSERVMRAMLGMKKIDIAQLQRAYDAAL